MEKPVATAKQQLGKLGELLVARHSRCPGCKRHRILKRLPANFKCADLICDFCGYLAQVKTATVPDVERLSQPALGAAWTVQKASEAEGSRARRSTAAGACRVEGWRSPHVWISRSGTMVGQPVAQVHMTSTVAGVPTEVRTPAGEWHGSGACLGVFRGPGVTPHWLP
jgi:hypothetical protein